MQFSTFVISALSVGSVLAASSSSASKDATSMSSAAKADMTASSKDAMTVTSSAKSAATGTGSGAITVHVVKVGSANGTLAYFPNNVVAAKGDMVQFQFQAGNHTVTQSTFDNPCEPISMFTHMNGIYSGFTPVAATSTVTPTYTIMINSTTPIWLYCSQGKHCQSGMTMVINEDIATNATQSLANYQAQAKLATVNLPGDAISGGSGGVASNSTGTSGSSMTASMAGSKTSSTAGTATGKATGASGMMTSMASGTSTSAGTAKVTGMSAASGLSVGRSLVLGGLVAAVFALLL